MRNFHCTELGSFDTKRDYVENFFGKIIHQTSVYEILIFVSLVVIYGISTLVGYFTPNFVCIYNDF